MKSVAAYCRVSTEESGQIGSFESQKAFFEAYIRERPDWTLFEIYADEGITGTSAEGRAGFMKMLCDAEKGKFSLLLTKEVSRFSRNLLDAVRYTRELRRLGVGVVFLNDGISTLDPDAELRLGIMASVAQEESRKTSERVKWGQQRKMERGVVFGRSLMGYDHRAGALTINPEGASLVRRIYDMFLNGRKGVRKIAEALTDEGVPTYTGGDVWSPASVLKVLKNEKYCGDLSQRKTLTPDFLTHRKAINRGEEALICLKDHHEPIVDRAVWVRTQEELARRSYKGDKSAHGSRYPLSGKIACARCGAVFTARTRSYRSGETVRFWKKTCSCPDVASSLKERDAADAVRRLVRESADDQLTGALTEAVCAALSEPSSDSAGQSREAAALKEKSRRLLELYLSGGLEKSGYLAAKKRLDETVALREKRRREQEIALKDAKGAAEAAIRSLLSGADEDGDFYLELVGSVRAGGDGAFAARLGGAEKINIEHKV